MVTLGLSTYDYALLLEKWEIKIVYPEETAKQIKKDFEKAAESFLLEKKGEPKTVIVRFYELGTGCISWVETFSTFHFTFQSHGFYGRQGVLTLRVYAIVDKGVHINMTPQEV